MIPEIKFENYPSYNGILSVIDKNDAGFEIQRVFYISDIPEGSIRGQHAHKYCTQILIPIQGTFVVHLKEKKKRHSSIYLASPQSGIKIPPGIWSSQDCIEGPGTLLVLADELYSEDEYLRNWKEYLEWKF